MVEQQPKQDEKGPMQTKTQLLQILNIGQPPIIHQIQETEQPVWRSYNQSQETTLDWLSQRHDLSQHMDSKIH